MQLAKHNVASATVRQKILRGNLPATKMGRDWFVEDTQEYVDKRVKTGRYKKEKIRGDVVYGNNKNKT